MNHFERRAGVADGQGESFEVKVIALLFLRGHNRCQNFRIASNMEYCGAFDDIVFQYTLNGIWRTSFMQLKHRKSEALTVKSFHTKDTEFDLFKYLKSYHEILQHFSSTTEHPVFGADLNHCSFFLYTNAECNTKRNLKHGEKLLVVRDGQIEEDIHNSSEDKGFVFGFSEKNKEDKFIMSLFKDLKECQKFVLQIFENNGNNPVIEDSLLREIEKSLISTKRPELKDLFKNVKVKRTKESLEELVSKLAFLSVADSFLSNVQVMDGQTGADNLNGIIKKEIVKACGTNEDESNEILSELLLNIEEWWRRGEEYLTKETQFWKDIMQSRAVRVAQVSAQKLQQLDGLNATFRDATSIPLTNPTLNVVADRGCTLLSCAKVRQALDSARQTKYMFVNADVLEHKEKELLALWPTRWCDTLVIDCEESATGNRQVLERLVGRGKLILVSGNALPNIESSVQDICGFEEMHEVTQNDILERTVVFQGYEVRVKSVTANNNDLNCKLTADLITQLLNGSRIHYPVVGKPLANLNFHYVKRKLQSCSTPNDGEVRPRSVWSLNERLLFLSADSGEGKTTFMTHMAIQSKEADLSSWISAIKLNEYSTNLDKLSDTDCTIEQAVEFLWEVEGRHSGTDFERAVFLHAVQTSGRSIVLLDGFDEIYPTYTAKTLQLIRCLMKSKVAKLCLAFRPLVKDLLESELRAQSFTLMPLTNNDRLELLKSRWTHVKDLMPRLPIERLELIRNMNKREFNKGDFDFHLVEYSQRLLDIISSKLSPSFCSIPLHVSLLATVFESYVAVSMEDKVMYVPEAINILDLYSVFVDIKLSLYYMAKKEEGKRSATKDDNELLHDYFTDRYKIVGVLAFLPDNLIEELHDKGLAKEVSTFLEKISGGKEKRGVVTQVVAGKPHFVHRTFAEYYSAMWFARNFPYNRTVLQAIYFSESYNLFREMFDRMLCKNHSLHQHTLDGITNDSRHSISTEVDGTDEGGRTALHYAAMYQKVMHPAPKWWYGCSFVDVLLYKGASVEVVDDVLGLTPLQYAESVSNWPGVYQMFRAQDIEPSHEDLATNCEVANCGLCVIRRLHTDVSTNLLVAVDSGNIDLALFLIAAGAGVECTDSEGNTPLHLAVRNCNLKLVQSLVESGADVGARNAMGDSAIEIAKSPELFSTGDVKPYCYRCIFHYSEKDRITLPFRNLHLLEFYYNTDFVPSPHTVWTYWSVFAESFRKKSAVLILEYLNGLPVKMK